MKYLVSLNLETDERIMEVENIPHIEKIIDMGVMGKLMLPLFNAPPNDSFPGVYMDDGEEIPIKTNLRFSSLIFTDRFHEIIKQDKICNANNCIAATIMIKKRRF